MGKYAEGLTDRLNHVGKKQPVGYCVICGVHGKLSKDHVPPQGAISVSKIEQHHIHEVLGRNAAGDSKRIKGVFSRNGSKFRTVCQTCNGIRIGTGDEEIKRTHSSLTRQIVDYYEGRTIFPFARVELDSVRYARSMCGHILSATSATECSVEPPPSPYFDPIKNFVIQGGREIFDTHDFHYWFYPYDRHMSAKLLGFNNKGFTSVLSLLAFHPIAFMISFKDKSTAPAQASKLKEGDEFMSLDISLRNVKYAKFPFSGLEENQLYITTDYLCITSKTVFND